MVPSGERMLRHCTWTVILIRMTLFFPKNKIYDIYRQQREIISRRAKLSISKKPDSWLVLFRYSGNPAVSVTIKEHDAESGKKDHNQTCSHDDETYCASLKYRLKKHFLKPEEIKTGVTQLMKNQS